MAATTQQLEQQIKTLLFAAEDMVQAAAAADALSAESDDVSKMRAFETALVTCYARPFTKGTGVGPLRPKKWVPAGKPRQLHHTLMLLRRKVYAHTDADSGRSARIEPVTGSDGVVHLTIAGGWWAFPRDWLPDIVTLCVTQAVRFRQEAVKLYSKL